jgi:predicted aspartyl protease
LLPAEVWTAVGLQAKRSMTFVLDDGTEIERGVSECKLQLLGQEAHSPVILGEPGDEPLLGAVTLEILGLMLDPLKRTLHAMRMRLA